MTKVPVGRTLGHGAPGTSGLPWGHARPSAASTPIRVYLLDDHEIVRRGIKELLESEGDIVVVGESGLAEEAARRIPALRPDVAILDGRLPDGSGIDVCREIRSRDPRIKALILTSYDDDEALFAAIMAGAAGYILKQVRGNDLVDTVRRVAAGQSMLDPAVTAQVLDGCATGRQVDTALEQLTAQEQRILELIGEGMTNRQIAEAMFLAEKTVKNYVSSMLAKLGLTSRTQAAIFATKHQPDSDSVAGGLVGSLPSQERWARGAGAGTTRDGEGSDPELASRVRRPAARGPDRVDGVLDEQTRLRLLLDAVGHDGRGPHPRRRAGADRGDRRRARRRAVRRARRARARAAASGCGRSSTTA